MFEFDVPDQFDDVLRFTLMEAITGRRSRRVFMGAEIPDGVFQYQSKHDPLPLSNFEKLLLLTACGGNTGWHNMIYRGERYAPHLSNYAGASGGQIFPSAAGFQTSKTFFTDDEGLYVLDVNNALALVDKNNDGTFDIEKLLQANSQYIKKVYDGRLKLPAVEPLVETAQHVGVESTRNVFGYSGWRFIAALFAWNVLQVAKRICFVRQHSQNRDTRY